MLKRIAAILLLFCLLPTCFAFADNEDEREEIIIPDEVPRGENGENQFIVPIGFDDNNLPEPLGPIYQDKTLEDFDKNSPALYTCRINEYTSGYPVRSIYEGRTYRTKKQGERGEVLHLDPLWAIVRYNGKIAYVKRHRIYDVQPVDSVNTSPYGVMKPQYIATTASTAEVHVSMTHEDICWVVLTPGTKVAIHKIVDGWAVVIYMRTYAYIDIRDLTDLVTVSPTDAALSSDTPIAAYTSFYKMDDTEKNHNRIHNIGLGAKRMSVVLQPGESFNANNQMGPYEESVGYLVAGALADGEGVDGVGGGTCQVSSTIYNALLQLPGVQIVKRRAHGENGAPYLPHGVDAAVGNDSLNLIFKNNYDFPIRLEGNTTGDGALTWIIYRADIEETE
ncbi:MAG: VanW family protein [Clostridia bacterium]|nr:VanW family protein [Clostridia bacterium]